MTYPLDQITRIVKANGDLVLGLADISRTSSEACFEAGRKAASAYTDRLRAATSEPKSFIVPDNSELVNELKTIQEQTIEKTQTALKTWQKIWGDTWKAAADQNSFTDIMAGLAKPWTVTAQPPAGKKSAAA